MDYDNSNSGVLFKNDKQGNDKRPDYTGKWEDENGKEWRLAAWIRDGKNGKFMSIKASESKPAEKAAPAAFDDDLSDLPF